MDGAPMKEWWKATEASSDLHPRNIKSSDPDRPNKRLVENGKYNQELLQLLPGDAEDPNELENLPSSNLIKWYNCVRITKKEPVYDLENPTSFQKVKEYLKESSSFATLCKEKLKTTKEEYLQKQLTKTNPYNPVELSPTCYKEKYYPQRLNMHSCLSAKWRDRKEGGLPKRTVSCAQKIACSSYWGLLFVATGESLLCLDQQTFKQCKQSNIAADGNEVWKLDGPTVECTSETFSNLLLDVSEGVQLHVAVANNCSLSVINPSAGTVHKTIVTPTPVVQLRWNVCNDKDTVATLAVVLENGALHVYDQNLLKISGHEEANATCVSLFSVAGTAQNNNNNNNNNVKLATGNKAGGVDIYELDTSLSHQGVEIKPVQMHPAPATKSLAGLPTVHVHWIEEDATVVAVHRKDGTHLFFDELDETEKCAAYDYYVHVLCGGVWQHMSSSNDKDDENAAAAMTLMGLPKVELQHLKIAPSIDTIYVPDLRMVFFSIPHTYHNEWDRNKGTPLLIWKRPYQDVEGTAPDATGGEWYLCHDQEVQTQHEALVYETPEEEEIVKKHNEQHPDGERKEDESTVERETTSVGCCMTTSLHDRMPCVFHLAMTSAVDTDHKGIEGDYKDGPLIFNSFSVVVSKVAHRWMNHEEKTEMLSPLPCMEAVSKVSKQLQERKCLLERKRSAPAPINERQTTVPSPTKPTPKILSMDTPVTP